jgi:hypothetical protein
MMSVLSTHGRTKSTMLAIAWSMAFVSLLIFGGAFLGSSSLCELESKNAVVQDLQTARQLNGMLVDIAKEAQSANRYASVIALIASGLMSLHYLSRIFKGRGQDRER